LGVQVYVFANVLFLHHGFHRAFVQLATIRRDVSVARTAKRSGKLLNVELDGSGRRSTAIMKKPETRRTRAMKLGKLPWNQSLCNVTRLGAA
jgi:hypothetical protein